MRARALFAAAYCALAQGDYDEAATRFEESLETYRVLGDRAGEARCLAQIGWLLLARGRLEQATAAATRASTWRAPTATARRTSVALADLAEVALRSRRPGARDAALRRGARRCGARSATAATSPTRCSTSAAPSLLAGDASDRGRRLEDGLALAREVADTWGTSLAQISLARVALDARRRSPPRARWRPTRWRRAARAAIAGRRPSA